MNQKLAQIACELQRSLSDATTLADGTLQLLGDAARQHADDARRDAFRALLSQIRLAVSEAADMSETIADALQEQL